MHLQPQGFERGHGGTGVRTQVFLQLEGGNPALLITQAGMQRLRGNRIDPAKPGRPQPRFFAIF